MLYRPAFCCSRKVILHGVRLELVPTQVQAIPPAHTSQRQVLALVATDREGVADTQTLVTHFDSYRGRDLGSDARVHRHVTYPLQKRHDTLSVKQFSSVNRGVHLQVGLRRAALDADLPRLLWRLHVVRVNPVNDILVHKGFRLCKQVAFLVFSLSRSDACHHQQTAARNDFPVQNSNYHPSLLFSASARLNLLLNYKFPTLLFLPQI